MKITTIYNTQIDLANQIREVGILQKNATGYRQSDKLFFVQFDDNYAVGSDGTIYQIVTKQDIHDDCTLYYKSESGIIFNYAEDEAGFEDEDLEIFEHCKEQAELLAD